MKLKINKTINQSHHAGIASLLIVLFLSLISTLIVVVIQSRLLLSVYRQQALSDTLKSLYDAESETYDIVERMLEYGAPVPPGGTIVKNGTEITVSKEMIDAETEKIIIVGARPYAVNRLEIERSVTAVAGVDKVEMVLALDCTGSMNLPSDPSNPGSISRYHAQREAAKNFVSLIKNMQPQDASRIFVGIEVFGGGHLLDADDVDAQWLTLDGDALIPTNNQQRLLDFLDQGFLIQGGRITRFSSPACCFGPNRKPGCQLITSATSVGSGYAFSNDYYAANPAPADEIWKRFSIVVTDGFPNSLRIPYPACPLAHDYIPPPPGPTTPPAYCDIDDPVPGYGLICDEEARHYLRCNLAKTDTRVDEIQYPYQSGLPRVQHGLRNTDVSAYGVVVSEAIPGEVTEIFTKYAGDGHYFDTANANDLSPILEGILDDILSGISNFIIRRVIP